MPTYSATAEAHPNIAFIKYWGNRDAQLRLPANGSISMNLDGLYTRTQVAFNDRLPGDGLTLNGRPSTGPAFKRVQVMLEKVREMAQLDWPASVVSSNNFPMGAGIASSAAAFAALSLAASRAAGLQLDEPALSRLARSGSGSACRSIPGGYVEWQMGQGDEDSYAFSLAGPEYWALTDCVAVVSQTHKPTGSTEGHGLADTSPLQAARVADTARRVEICRRAILERDFAALAQVVEQDCNLMHGVMMTSQPALLYWQPSTLAVMHAVQDWRRAGLEVCYTIDAGPNVHVLCPSGGAAEVQARLVRLPGVQQVLLARPGGAARIVEQETAGS